MEKKIVDQIYLHCTEGGSDKVYNLQLCQVIGGYFVDFQYGRRGNSLVEGSKTTSQIGYDNAKKIYDKLIREKIAKGYRVDSSSVTSSTSGGVHPGRLDSGFRPQLLNSIDASELDKYIDNPFFCSQEKQDGERRMIEVRTHDMIGINKKGVITPINSNIKNELLKMDAALLYKYNILDGEVFADHIVIFDCFEANLTDGHLNYFERYQKLMELFKGKKFKHLKLAGTALTRVQKIAMLSKLKTDNAEGIVFKDLRALYKPGRPASGGDQLKFKFTETATCMVEGLSKAKRSIELAMFDKKGEQISVGNVTVYPNQTIPNIGDFVEVRYLYYYKDGSLFQPVLLGEGDCTRKDVDNTDCNIKQLKIKRGVPVC